MTQKCKATGKVRHPSKQAACVVVSRQKRKPILNVYPCNQCGGWHTGRSNDPYRNADWIGTLLRSHKSELDKRNGAPA